MDIPNTARKEISVFLNKNKITLANKFYLDVLLMNQNFPQATWAVAVNKKFVPREKYDQTVLSDGDCIDILIPMQGG